MQTAYDLGNYIINMSLPMPKREFLKKNTFKYSGVKLWNVLPVDVRQAPSIYAFKNDLSLLAHRQPSKMCKNALDA